MTHSLLSSYAMRLFLFGNKKRTQHTRVAQDRSSIAQAQDAFSLPVRRARRRFVAALILVVAVFIGRLIMPAPNQHPKQADKDIMIRIIK